MASGLLGSADLTAATYTTLYTVPAATTASFSVCFTNRSTTMTTVRLAIAATGTPANSEFVTYDFVLQGNASYERTGLVAQTAKNVVVYAAAANVTALAYGYEG